MRYRIVEALLTTAPVFGRLAPLSDGERDDMTERRYDQLQARAINNLDDSLGEEPGSKEALLARAQVHALLAVGAAIKDLADAIREGR